VLPVYAMMRGMRLGMVVTDLDGTLLNAEHEVSAVDRQTLEALGQRGIIRVIATGRSLYSARRVLSPELPIDYLVHTSGAGVFSWPAQQALHATHMESSAARELAAQLVSLGCDFMLHHKIPHEHHFYAHRASADNPDFEQRIRLYAAYAQELNWPRMFQDEMCHVVVIEPPDVSRHEQLRAVFTQFHVVRTTSPLDGVSTWTEIFPRGVSKAQGAAWVRERHGGGVRGAGCIAIGNDYNDLDLLAWADRAYVVENAPADLRDRYTTVPSHRDSGFSGAVQSALVCAGPIAGVV